MDVGFHHDPNEADDDRDRHAEAGRRSAARRGEGLTEDDCQTIRNGVGVLRSSDGTARGQEHEPSLACGRCSSARARRRPRRCWAAGRIRSLRRQRNRSPLADGSGRKRPVRRRQAERRRTHRRKGHGRNGADAYAGAEKIAVPHESLQPGDPCPKCEKGTVYETGRPGVLVRLVGQAPIQAKIYELQKLRCNLCGVVFTAQPPAGVGAEKYDATAGSMIAVLKYGSGMPFNREEKLQASLGIPLPASTQWEIVRAKAEKIEPAFEELIRQAAQGEVVHNDDTTVKILELMGERARKASRRRKRRSDDAEGSAKNGRRAQGHVHLGHRFHQGRPPDRPVFQRTQARGREPGGRAGPARGGVLAAPIQMCDALTRNLPGELETIVAHCLAHGRRRFVEVADRFPEECRYVLESLAVIYRNDAIARERKLSPAARRHFHQAESGPVMEELHVWLGRQLEDRLVEPNSSLGGAISYMLKHWES